MDSFSYSSNSIQEFLITGLRLVAAAKGKTLAAEKIGKIKTVVQLLCISFF